MKTAAKEVKPKSKTKKIIDIVVTCIEVAIVIIAITISAIVIANPTADAVSGSGVKLMPVLTDSMIGENKDSFNPGDLIIGKTPKDVFSLEVGQVITYTYPINGVERLNTHRIVDVKYDGSGRATSYVTHGDHNPTDMVESVNPNWVKAVYAGKVKGMGKAILWLQDATHFLLIIVLPLGILFIYNIVMFVMMLMRWNAEKAKASVIASAPAADPHKLCSEFAASGVVEPEKLAAFQERFNAAKKVIFKD